MKRPSLNRCVCGSEPEVFIGSRGWTTIRCPKCLHRVFGSGESKTIMKWNWYVNFGFEGQYDAPYSWIEKKKSS